MSVKNSWLNEIRDAGGRKIAVDDMLLVAGIPATAGSRMLESFVPLFDAEAVVRAKKAGYTVAGKTNVGEFGLDLLGETSAFGAVVSPDGTLSGASARAVADGEATAALNVDLNGAPRRAAALAGVTFLKPTYGTVSRYGVIPCACSGEQVGVTARCAADAAALMTAIAGHDAKDGTSLPADTCEYGIKGGLNGKRFCLPEEYLRAASADMRQRVTAAAEALKAAGAAVESVSFAQAKQAQQAWQILMAAETCNNLSRYDGVKFGYRSEKADDIDALYVNSRSESLGPAAKTIILYGSDVLSKGRYAVCYDKALRVRRMVREALDALFRTVDGILLPACGRTRYEAPPAGRALQAAYTESFFTAPASLTGIPAVVTGGVQLMADSLKDGLLLDAAACLEKEGGAL